MESSLKLRSADILLKVNRGRTPIEVAELALGVKHSHVSVYVGEISWRVSSMPWPQLYSSSPRIFESIGRGVLLSPLSTRYGELTRVLRLKPHLAQAIPPVLQNALVLAGDPQAAYDYQCIVEYLIPGLIAQRLGLPLPVKYHRNGLMVCSEAALEIFLRAGATILPDNIAPLPDDFLLSGWLDNLGVYELSEGMV